MNFTRRRSTQDPFWIHFAHLAVRELDNEGRPIRVLDVKRCEPCRRLWAQLWPRGTRFPATIGVGLGGLYVRADVLDAPAPARVPAERAAPAQSPSTRRLDEFTNERARAARLEHY